MPQSRVHADAAAKQRAYRERQAQARRAEREQKGLPAAAPIPAMPSAARWTAMQVHAYDLLNSLQAEMQAYYEERSEQWQESEKGEEFQRKIDSVQEAIDALDQS